MSAADFTPGLIEAAKVIVQGTVYGFDAEYTYRIPNALRGTVRPGQRVIVPFGRGNRRHVGLVMSVYEREDEEGIKLISTVCDPEPLINGELIELIRRIKETTFCTYFDAFRTMIPAGYSISFRRSYVLSSQRPDEPLPEGEAELYEKLLSCKTPREEASLLSSAPAEILESLADKGLLERAEELKRKIGDETVTMVKLSDEYFENGVEHSLSAKGHLAEEFLLENGPASVKELMYNAGVTRTIIDNMVKKGVLTKYKYETFRTPKIAPKGSKPEDIILTSEQQTAYDGILKLIAAGKPAGALLYGVTGSGKTSVFIKLIDEVTNRFGKTAMMLVPEISLTPQLVAKFKAAFGDTVAVIHSALSLGERMDEFKRAKSGAARIVIGTRSAVFAPLENIGIIIMDEEGEGSYKSDSSPRYHARDIAARRAKTHSCTLLLASATPSLESYYYAKTNRYSLFEMKTRYNSAPLPQVVVADMGAEAESGNHSPFCVDLVRAVSEEIKKGNQAIILLNRRGYSTSVVCCDCHEAVKCPNCLLPLTHHKTNDRLMCHTCGYSVPFSGRCPVCGSDRIRLSGYGTQQIEAELEKAFPGARILRMDADSASSRMTYEDSFRDFEEGRYDIMVGTQMIAKGLDFPKVTVVGVISLDNSLFSGSYRSYERTFSLLTQVAGRGGRGSEPGVAYIQTYLPDHYVIELASRHDYPGFYEQEIALRRQLIYPPFCDLIIITFAAVLESQAAQAAREFLEIIRAHLKTNGSFFPLRVLGPAKAGSGRARRRYRYCLTLKTRCSDALRAFLRDALTEAYKSKKFADASISVDVNPDTIN